MKKLLLLGGDHLLMPVINAAHELGCHVITCDYLPDNIAHKYSDEYFNASTTDKDSILEFAKNSKIDGVLTFTDSGVVAAGYVAEKLRLPSPGPYESIKILQNKALFRDFLKKNEFNVPVAKGYESIEDAIVDLDRFRFPVIVKPVDSAGSKGVSKVDGVEGVENAVKFALEYSMSKHFIIEEFIEKKGCSSDCDCFSVDGEMKAVYFSSQHFDTKSDNQYTPASYSWPSTISDENQRVLRDELQRLISLLGMRTSIYNVEVRESVEGIPYIMEVSPRGGGNRLAEMVRYATGVDMIRNSVRMALGIRTEHIDTKPFNGYWAEIILHSNRSGIFNRLEIDQKMLKNVVETDLWVKDGDEIHEFSSARFAIGTLVMRFEDAGELEKAISKQSEWLKVMVK